MFAGGIYDGTLEAEEIDEDNSPKRRKVDQNETMTPTYHDEEASSRTQEVQITTIESENDSPDISDGSSEAEDE